MKVISCKYCQASFSGIGYDDLDRWYRLSRHEHHCRTRPLSDGDYAAKPHTWKVGDECEPLSPVASEVGDDVHEYTPTSNGDSCKCGEREDHRWHTAEPEQPADPLDAVIDGVRLRTLIDGDEFNRRESSATYRAKRMTPAQRSAVSAHWSAQLRARVAAAKERERCQVMYCEIDADD